MAKVFVSYKREDRERVRSLVDALDAAGLTVWWDVALAGGVIWRQAIQTELDAAACVIVVWSKSAVGPEGHFVHDEAAHAVRRGVYLPVRIDRVEPPLGFGQRQLLPLENWRGDRDDPRLLDLLAAARAMVAGLDAPVARATPRRRRRRWSVVLAIIAASVGGLILLPRTVLCSVGIDCRRPAAAVAPANSIAVLPFANLSADPAQAYFSDGLSEELLSALAGIDTLQVAARTSSFKFKNSRDTSSTIGAKLGVAFILDGSVRRSGDRVRVSAQLVEAASGFERWSDTYDRDLTDVFAVQRGIAEAVAAALRVRLADRAVAALGRAGTASAAANDAYLRGRAALDAGIGEAGMRSALVMFDTAVAADPRFAEAHAARARALLAMANQFLTASQAQRAAYDAAEAAARRAVALAPDSAEAQSSLAGVLLYGRFDIAGARRAYDLALRTGSGNADILLRYGLFACRTGAVGPGLAAIQQAVRRDPFNARAFKTLGLSLIVARSYPEAIVALRRALTLNPAIIGVHSAIGDALLLQGDIPAAATEYAAEPETWERLRGQAIAHARLGDRAGSTIAFNAMVADGGDSTTYQQAQVHAQRGEAAPALAALTRAYATHDAGILLIGSDPLLDPVRTAAGFAAIARRLEGQD